MGTDFALASPKSASFSSPSSLIKRFCGFKSLCVCGSGGGRGTDDGSLLVCLSVLPVPVQYLPLVTEAETSEQLKEQHLYIVRVEGSRVLLHVAAQVCVQG